MEERRIGMLYLDILKRRVAGLFGGTLRRSSIFPFAILFLVLVIPAGIWYAHTRALFHRTKEKIGDDQQIIVSTGPGGRDPLQLTRAATPGSHAPEFVSATVLPGLGLDLVQISASIPGKGVVPLLVAPTMDELTAGTAPRSGPNDLHGALEVPWGGLLTGLRNVLGTSLMMDFQGNTISVPTDGRGTPISAEGGLMQNRIADTAAVTSTPGGASITGTLTDSDFDGHWRSKTQVRLQTELNGSSVDLTIWARNTGEEAAPMGVGWHPRFQLAGDRANVQLLLPRAEMLEITDHTRELPTGRILAANDALSRFMEHPEPLRTVSLDDALVRLKPGAPGGVSAELRDPAAGYGLRITALSSSIGELRLYAPVDGNFISIGFQTNLDDPLGHIWTGEEPGILILQPGQTLEYKVRLEIFPLSHS